MQKHISTDHNLLHGQMVGKIVILDAPTEFFLKFSWLQVVKLGT